MVSSQELCNFSIKLWSLIPAEAEGGGVEGEEWFTFLIKIQFKKTRSTRQNSQWNIETTRLFLLIESVELIKNLELFSNQANASQKLIHFTLK